MKKNSKTLIWLSIVLSLVCLVWLCVNSFLYRDIPHILVRQNIYTKLIGYGLLVILFSHFATILAVTLSSKKSRRMAIAGNILSVLGVVSFISLLLHLLALHGIMDNFTSGYSLRSILKLVWYSQSALFIFFTYSFLYFIILACKGENCAPARSISREQIFVALNIIGIVCSILGILTVLVYFRFQCRPANTDLHNHLHRSDVIPYGFIVLPYILVLAGWCTRYFNDRRSGWNDEKQKFDINSSGMVSLLTSLPLLICLTIFGFLEVPSISDQIYISGTITILWLPFYLFFVLFIFSVTTLYKYKNN